MIREPKISEQKMKLIVDNYATMSLEELGNLIGVKPGTVSTWALNFKKHLINSGISKDVVERHFPRKQRPNVTKPVFDKIASEMFDIKFNK